MGGGRKLRYCGMERIRFWMEMTTASYSLVRLSKLTALAAKNPGKVCVNNPQSTTGANQSPCNQHQSAHRPKETHGTLWFLGRSSSPPRCTTPHFNILIMSVEIACPITR